MFVAPVLPEEDVVPPPRGSRCSSCLRVADFLINDFLMVLFSVSDIVLDILVCRSFYLQGQMSFFYASSSIFLFAQCCYSFLFVLHWCHRYNPQQQVLAFFFVLPFGQIVPFLFWIESFNFAIVSKAFNALNLKSNYFEEVALISQEIEGTGGDTLYAYIKKKFYSHGGFLIEALAEAIPQSILQTIAVLYFGEASLLFIVSIFVSICVISSKGYLVSYSMHRPTFVFNILSVFADVLCLFATVCWLFSSDDEEDPMFNFEDGVKLTWFVLFGSSCALMSIATCFAVLFKMLDSQLSRRNLRYPWKWLDTLIFDMALLLGWVLSLTPVLVSVLTFKFIVISPVGAEKMFEKCEHASYKSFYANLHGFLREGKSNLKLQITNKFILHCVAKKDTLDESIARCLRRDDINSNDALQSWLREIGNEMDPETLRSKLHKNASYLVDALGSDDSDFARAEVKKLYDLTLSRAIDETTEFLTSKTAIFDHVLSGNGNHASTALTVYVAVALFFAAVAAVALTLWAIVAFVFLIFSIVYPVIEMVREIVKHNADLTSMPLLPFVLTIFYLITVTAILALFPSALNFFDECTELVPLNRCGLSSVFYSTATLQRLEELFETEVTWQQLDSVFDDKFGMDVTLLIKSFCEDSAVNVWGLYGLKNLRKLDPKESSL